MPFGEARPMLERLLPKRSPREDIATLVQTAEQISTEISVKVLLLKVTRIMAETGGDFSYGNDS